METALPGRVSASGGSINCTITTANRPDEGGYVYGQRSPVAPPSRRLNVGLRIRGP
ncbi:MAG TPA: hypothetical protein VH599_00180 [Ktedonobacterales bacterium]